MVISLYPFWLHLSGGKKTMAYPMNTREKTPSNSMEKPIKLHWNSQNLII